ncbi:MAG: glutathione S-transferase N-terminal domain-containing protein [Pseudomonadota bacterium]
MNRYARQFKAGNAEMQLYYSRNSPFARVVRVAAIECGLAPRIDHVEVVNRDPDSPLLAFSPVCRVPTLVDGTLVIGEARNICAYFDHLVGEPTFLAGSQASWSGLAFESMALGFLDATGVWVRENRREKHQVSDFIMQVEHQRANRCLDDFETKLSSQTDASIAWDFAGLAVACAIGVLDHNELLSGWRATRPKLALWYEENASRASMCDTQPR